MSILPAQTCFSCNYVSFLEIIFTDFFIALSQHQELFSKLAFGINKYLDYDMSKLDITVVSGYAAYMALTSNGQGKNGEVALEALHRKTNGLSIAEWCSKHPT